MRRAIAYLRVSTSVQADDGLGLDIQRDKVTAYAAEHDLELLEIVEEVSSGGIRNGETFSWEHRPVLLDLLGRAENSEYDVLLVARLDRLSRDHVTLVALERQLQRHGVEVISTAEENNGDGPVAQLLRSQRPRKLPADRVQQRFLTRRICTVFTRPHVDRSNQGALASERYRYP